MTALQISYIAMGLMVIIPIIGLGIIGIVKIISITPTKDGFALVIDNEFDEKEDVEIFDNEKFELYILE